MNSRMAGQTINDRFLAARHSIAGQGLAKSVCKATTEEMIAPKKKHLDYLVHCTNEPNVSIPQLATLLIERSQNTNWVVVYKALITVHHMMCYGNERFTQYLASSNSTFQLSNFLDKSGTQGVMNARTGYEMSPFIRSYAGYLNEKALSYRTVAFDFCKIKRGKEDGVLRTMNPEKLLKTVPVLQCQLDALLEFHCFANDLTNGVINMCFMLLFRDLIRLFACYNDGIINLLEKYFDMNKKQCRDALDVYKKFLIRMDRVAEFLKVAEYVGIDKGDIPDLTKAPSSLLDALEQHLAFIDGKKVPTSGTPTSASHQKNIKSGVSALSSTSSAFGVANGRLDALANNGIDENIKLQVLAEEEAAMNQYKSKVQTSTSNGASSPMNNPFLDSPPIQKTTHMDFFAPQAQNAPAPRASDDLLQLSNPFGDVFPQAQQQKQPPNIYAWMNEENIPNSPVAYSSQPQSIVTNGSFVSQSNFTSVFGSANVANDVLQPSVPQATNGTSPNTNNRINTQTTTNGNGSALITGDLESSLASLAENLTINRTPPVKSVQWNSPKGGSKMSSVCWTPQPMSATTEAGYKPMNQAMPPTNNMMPAMFPQMQPIMGMRSIPTNTSMLPTLPAMPTNTMGNPMGQQQSLLFH